MLKPTPLLSSLLVSTALLTGFAQTENQKPNALYEMYKQHHSHTKTLYPKPKELQTKAPAQKVSDTEVKHTHAPAMPHSALKQVTIHKQQDTQPSKRLSEPAHEKSITYTLPVPPTPVRPIPKEEIAKAVQAVEAVKAEAAQKILEALKIIKAVKPIQATKVITVVPSAVDVIKAEAVAEIAKATAFAHSANSVAKAKIAKAVAKVQIAELTHGNKPATREEVRQAKEKSAAEIAKAVAAAEITKAKSAAKIAESVAEVEKTKAKKYPSLSEKLFGKAQ